MKTEKKTCQAIKNNTKTCASAQLFIISSPSGGGKTTLCKEVLKYYNNILYSVSYTTREPRRGEKNGIDYYFIREEEFKEGIRNGKWAEWAKVYGNYYGTSTDFINNGILSGKHILLDIDVQGAAKLIKYYPESITIFIMPPSIKALRSRLEARSADSKKTITKRLEAAEKEIKQNILYKHVLVNEQLPAAIKEIISIFGRYMPNTP